MFALHGLWRADHRLALWAEDPRRSAERPGPGLRSSSSPLPHPYACPAETVKKLLGGVGPALDWLADQCGEGRTDLLLPSRAGGPLPSPELCLPLGERAARRTASAVGLESWRVPSLLFAPDEAAQLLGELFEPRMSVLLTELAGAGAVEIHCGASLRWLTGVHDLAWRLVGRGQVLPTLLVRDGMGYARWLPFPDPVQWREISSLGATCPPVCRAEPSGGRPAGPAASEIVADLLDVLVDREVRAALEHEPLVLPPARGRRPTTPSTAELWFTALASGDGRIDDADAVGLTALQAQLTAWHRSGAPPAPGPLRTCFRLVEPLGPDPADPEGGTSDDHWRLEFLVQAVDEPSLLVGAADIWEGRSTLAALTRKLDRPREAFLAELGRAAGHYPQLRIALRDAKPTALALDRSGALGFLREAAPALTSAGFGVMLPTWWQRPARWGMKLTARMVEPGRVETAGPLDQDAVVAFRWQAVLGGRPLTDQELSDLARAKEPLVRVRGQWMEVDTGQIAAATRFLERAGSGTGPARDVLRTLLDPESAASPLPVTEAVAEGRLGGLLADRAEPRMEPVPLPKDFGAVLRPYQERGLAWLVFLSRLGVGAVLADDMGLGKTVQVLALLAVEHAAGQRPLPRSGPEHPSRLRSDAPTAPTLLICPMSLVGNWQRETAGFAPMLRVHIHHGTERLKGDALLRAVSGADFVITTYGVAHRDAQALGRLRWRRIVLDEAQQLKNSATQQSKAIRALPAGHRIALTGTPVENRLAELHTVLDFANPGLFGSPAGFKERYSVPIEQGGDESAAAALRRHTRPFMLRRLKSDPAVACDLPAKNEMTVLCGLTAEQASLYRAVVADLLSRIEETRGLQRRGLVLSTLGKLKAVCNHPAHYLLDGSRLAGRSGKLARLEETLELAIAGGDKALCFTQFAEFGSLLRTYLTRRLGTEVLFLYGGTSRREREEMTARFQNPAGPPVMILSLKAGGTGLNLTAASHVIHIDRWWNPAVEDQATDRAHRIGQRKDVQVRTFVCAGTVEERIASMIETKRTLARAVVGTGEHWLTELSTDALREAVALSPDRTDA